MSFVDRFCVSRKGGQGNVGRFPHRVNKALPCLGSVVERPWLAMGPSFAVCTDELGKQSSGLVGPPKLDCLFIREELQGQVT